MQPRLQFKPTYEDPLIPIIVEQYKFPNLKDLFDSHIPIKPVSPLEWCGVFNITLASTTICLKTQCFQALQEKAALNFDDILTKLCAAFNIIQKYKDFALHCCY
jgi:hypothetical protein